MKGWLGNAFNWFFPLYCAGCGSEDWAICPACKKNIQQSGDECFGQEAVPAPFSELLDGLAALFVYEKRGVVAEALHLYKYSLIDDYGRELWQLWRNNLSQSLLMEIERNIDLISWIPLHPRKEKSRGFNQSAMLAVHLPTEKLKLPFLLRRSDTAAQMSLQRQQRLQNMQGAFVINNRLDAKTADLRGKSVLLVDDVVTTGATLGAAAAALKGAGAAAVFALVLARQKE